VFLFRSCPPPSNSPPQPRSPPRRLGRVLNLVRKLIDYGKQLAVTVQQRAGTPGFAFLVRPFGTADIAVILARITCGLRRAAMLEAKLCKRAERGRDLTVPPIRLPAIRVPGAAREAAPRDVQPADPAQDPRLARLPTEEEIAEEVRRRPVGAVIVDICCDLGIAPGRLDRAFWDEINHALMVYGGSSVRFFNDLEKRLWAFGPGDPSDDVKPEWLAAAQRSPAPATGPP
jgi:hypothetical protein